MTKEHTSEEIKYRLSDLGVQIGNIAIEYITDLEQQIDKMKKYLDCEFCKHYTESYGCKGCDETLKNKWELKNND